MAIWNSVAIPITVSFDPLWAQENWYKSSDMFITICFAIDIFFAFNTSYFSVDGEEIIERKLIATRYLKGMFFIDFISTVPLGAIDPSLNVTAILKVVRIRRLGKMINKLSVTEETKAVSALFKLISYHNLYKATF